MINSEGNPPGHKKFGGRLAQMIRLSMGIRSISKGPRASRIIERFGAVFGTSICFRNNKESNSNWHNEPHIIRCGAFLGGGFKLQMQRVIET